MSPDPYATFAGVPTGFLERVEDYGIIRHGEAVLPIFIDRGAPLRYKLACQNPPFLRLVRRRAYAAARLTRWASRSARSMRDDGMRCQAAPVASTQGAAHVLRYFQATFSARCAVAEEAGAARLRGDQRNQSMIRKSV
jgi:hypothetical protein